MNDGQSKPDAKHVWGVQECQNKQYLKKNTMAGKAPNGKSPNFCAFLFSILANIRSLNRCCISLQEASSSGLKHS